MNMARVLMLTAALCQTLSVQAQEFRLSSSRSAPAPAARPLGPTLPAPSAAQSSPDTTLSYTVKASDTLHAIAQRYGTSSSAIAQLNRLNSSTIHVGQVLRIPAPTALMTVTPDQPASLNAPFPPAAAGKLQIGLFKPKFTVTTASTPGNPIWPVPFIYQTYNNCGPSSIAMLLSFYGKPTTQAQYQKRLRPTGGYMTVESGLKLLSDLGMRPTRKKNSTLNDLKAALQRGPVMVLQWHSVIGKTPHFRVVTGFDAQRDFFYVNDPLSGAGLGLTSHDLNLLWNTQGRQMVTLNP